MDEEHRRDGTTRSKVERLKTRSAGEDDADPYASVEVSELPSWWQQAIETFQTHDLRPYRPPQFEDGTPKHEVVEQLEDALEIDIRFVCLEVENATNWTVLVDNTPIGRIGHRRSPEGYSVYEMGSEDFEHFVRSNTDG